MNHQVSPSSCEIETAPPSQFGSVQTHDLKDTLAVEFSGITYVGEIRCVHEFAAYLPFSTIPAPLFPLGQYPGPQLDEFEVGPIDHSEPLRV